MDANVTLVQTTVSTLKRGSEHVHLTDSPREKLRKSMSKRLVITSTDIREEDISDILHTMKVKDVPFECNFCSKTLLNEDECIAKAIDSLLSRKIACAQVVKGSNTVAIFNIGDLAVYCCSRFRGAKDAAAEVVKIEEEFLEMPLKKIICSSNWKSIRDNSPLSDLLTLFATPTCDRVIVENEKKGPIGVLTRSELVGYIHKNRKSLKSKLSLCVKDLNSHAVSASNNSGDDKQHCEDSVRNGFNGLWMKQTSGLLANGSLMSSLRKFLNLVQYVHYTVEEENKVEEDELMVRTADTLDAVIEMMSERNTETLRVLDGENNEKYLHFFNVLQAFQPLTSS